MSSESYFTRHALVAQHLFGVFQSHCEKYSFAAHHIIVSVVQTKIAPNREVIYDLEDQKKTQIKAHNHHHDDHWSFSTLDFWIPRPMNAAKIGSKQYYALTISVALICAGYTLLFTLPTFNNQTPFQTTAVVAATLDEITITAPTPLSDAVVLEPGAVLQSKYDQDGNGETPNSQQKLSPSIIIKNATITLLQASTAQGRSTPQSKTQNSTANLIAALRSLGFKNLELDNTNLQLKRPGGSLQSIGHVTCTIHADKALIILRAEGRFVRHGKTLTFTAQTKPDQKDPTAKKLQANVSGGNIKLKLNGKLLTKDGMRVTSEDARFTTKNLKQVLQWLGMGTLESNGFNEFSASGNMSWSGSTVAFDQSQLSIDNNKANGRLSFYFDPREPAIEGTLAFQTLELTPYLGPSEQPSAFNMLAKAWSGIRTAAAKGALPLGLKIIDADIRLSAKSLLYGNTNIGHGAAVLLVKDGKLKADIAEMSLANGARGRSQVEIDVTGFMPRYVLHGDINGLDLGALSTRWFGKPIVVGIANMTFDVVTQGKTNKELLATLSGPMVMTAQKSVSIPIDLEKLFSKAKTSPNDGWDGIENGFTAFQDLSVDFMSSKGSLKTNSARATIDGSTIVATGSLKLTDFLLDLVLTKRAISSDNSAHQDTLEFKGPITQPIIRLVPQPRQG